MTKAATPTAEPTELATVTDQFAGLSAFAADAWEPPPVQPSESILTFAKQMIEHGKAAISIQDWPTAKVRQFRKELTAALAGRTVAFKVGTLKDGNAGLRITLTTPRAKG